MVIHRAPDIALPGLARITTAERANSTEKRIRHRCTSRTAPHSQTQPPRSTDAAITADEHAFDDSTSKGSSESVHMDSQQPRDTPFAVSAPESRPAQGWRRHPRHRRTLQRQPGHRHGVDGRAHRHQPGLLAPGARAGAAVRLRQRQRAVGLAGACPPPRSVARHRNDFRNTGTPRTPTSSCCPAPRTWCRCIARTRTAAGWHPIPAFIASPVKPGYATGQGSWSSTKTSATATGSGATGRASKVPSTGIERWTRIATGEVHRRTLSGDNRTTLYGTDAASRICDPHDPTRVFEWLIRAALRRQGQRGGLRIPQGRGRQQHRSRRTAGTQSPGRRALRAALSQAHPLRQPRTQPRQPVEGHRSDGTDRLDVRDRARLRRARRRPAHARRSPNVAAAK